MTREVTSFIKCMPFSDARMTLLCFQGFLSIETNQPSLRNFGTWCLYMLNRFLLSRFTMHCLRSLISSSGQDRKKRLCVRRKKLQHLESGEVLCFHRPKTVMFSTRLGFKHRMGGLHSLFSNVFSRLYAPIKQSINDCREQTWCRNYIQLALI